VIAIVDYGMGNLKSVTNAFKSLDAGVVVTSDAKEIQKSHALVVPGVGAFGKCIDNLKKYGLFSVLKEQISEGKPYLGICLGMQILLEGSEESPGIDGLGVIQGQVVRFQGSMKIPHMGWNSAKVVKPLKIFEGIPDESYFYFVHSFYPHPTEDVAATITEYGVPFASSISKGNVFACQFHPEKSQHIGLQMLKNFVSTVNQ
jgi:glutamine amidotransferase